MANRYWVGGSGNWNSTSKWSTTSGGASGASVPTSSDDVFFDDNSDAGADFTVTLPVGNHDCRNFDASGLSTFNMVLFSNFVLFTGSGVLRVAGPSGLTGSSRLSFSGQNNALIGFSGAYVQLTNTTGYNISIGSADGTNLALTITAASGTYGLANNLTIFSLQLSGFAGTFNTNNYNFTSSTPSALGGVFSVASNSPTINLGSSIIDVNSFGLVSGVTLNAGTSTIRCLRLTPASKTLYNVEVKTGPAAGPGSQNVINDSFTCTNITFVYVDATNKYIVHSANVTITVTGTISRTGGSNDMTFQPRTGTTVLTMSKASGIVGIDYVTLVRQTASGGATFYAGANSTNGGNNTGWIFTAPPAQTLTMPTISAGSVTYAPTVSPGSVSLSVPFISSAAQLYGPILSAGAITITAPLLTNTSVLYEPTILPIYQLEAPFINSTQQLYSPSLELGPATIELPIINLTNQLYTPELTAGPITISLPAITNTSTLYSPTVNVDAVTLSLPAISSSNALYGPTLTAGAVSVQLPLIASNSVLYAPTLTAGAITISFPLIASSNSLYGPTITAGTITITAPLLSNVTTLYAPTITAGSVTINLPYLQNSSQLYGPSITVGAIAVTIPLLTNINSLFAPTIIPGAATISLPFVASNNQLYGPVLTVGDVAIILPVIDSVNQLYAPTLVYDQGLSLPFILSLAEAFAPRVYRMAEDPVDQGEDTIIALGMDDLTGFYEPASIDSMIYSEPGEAIVISTEGQGVTHLQEADSNVMDNSNARY